MSNILPSVRRLVNGDGENIVVGAKFHRVNDVPTFRQTTYSFMREIPPKPTSQRQPSMVSWRWSCFKFLHAFSASP